MSVSNPTTGEVFSIRIFKYHLLNPSRVWANTYEVQTNGTAPTTSDLVTVVNRIVAFERAITFDVIVYDRAIVSTHVPDGTPYNPSSFITIPLLSAAGTQTPSTGLLDLSVCVLLRRDVLLGRNGRLLIRGALREADVDSPSGSFSIQQLATFTNFVNNAVLSSNVDDHLEFGSNPTKLVMYDGNANNTRLISNLVVAGVAIKKLANRFYNKLP